MPKKIKTPRRVMDDPALREAMDRFKAQFPEIMDDEDLFRLADGLTIKLQEEHPDWTTEKIMFEAGRKVREKCEKKVDGRFGLAASKFSSIGGQAAAPPSLGGLGSFGSGIQAGKTAAYEAKWKQEQFEMEREHRKRQRFNMPPVGSTNKQQRILSRPVPVHWAGWETDTLRLQRAGWQLAVDFEPMRDMYALMMKHPEMNMTALTSAIRLDHGLSLMDNYQNRGYSDPASGVNHMTPFNVIKVAPQFENVRIQSTGTWENFQLIDAEPQMVDTVIERPEDLNIFALAMSQAEQVAIDQADMSVVEHLEAIKDLQSDEQKELREKARKREARREGENAVTGEVIVQLVDYKH